MFATLVTDRKVREDVIKRGFRSFEIRRIRTDVFKVTHDCGIDLYRVTETGKIVEKLFK